MNNKYKKKTNIVQTLSTRETWRPMLRKTASPFHSSDNWILSGFNQ